MTKEYLNRKLRKCDRRGIEKMIRELRPLIHPPTIGIDYYSIDALRSNSRNHGIIFKAVLDNNIVSRMLHLGDTNNVIDIAPDEETKRICGILAYLTYTGIEIVPELALYEKKTPEGPSQKLGYDYALRIIDHIAPQYLADLWSCRRNQLPRYAYREAKAFVDDNELIKSDIEKHNYEDESQPGVIVAYTNMMYAWILYKTEINPEERLKMYLDWSFRSSLGSQQLCLFVATFLSNNRFGRMIKNVNTNDSCILLENIRNVSWDIFYLCSLELLIDEGQQRCSWCFVTRDKLLTEIGPCLLNIVDQNGLEAFFRHFFSDSTISLVMDHLVKLNTRVNRQEHIKQVESQIDSEVTNLEREVRRLLA